MDREGLLGDLKALHHGRGLRRAGVRGWLGPDLLEALGATPQHSDAELRVALARLLALHTQALPRDLRELFRTAVGLDVDLPRLEDRMERAAEGMDRSVRVLRRRLREAEVLMADAILHQRASTNEWWDAQGWQWLGLDASLVLRDDAVMSLRHEVLALTAQPKYASLMFTIPGILPGDEEPTFEALLGFTILQVERTGPTGWRLSLELPRDLGPGEAVDTVIRIRVPRASALQPYVVLAPLRETPHARVEVDFGDSFPGTSYWVLNGVLPTDLGPVGTMPVPRDAKPAVGRVTCDFTPRVGLAYGIAWDQLEPKPA